MQDEFAVKQETAGPKALYAGLALGLALVFFLMMASVADNVGYSTVERDIALLAPIAAHKDSARDVTVVMLGNSRLRHAITDTPETLPDGRRLWTVQYALNVALWEDYEALWPHIIAAKPDYIVVQDTLITTARLIELMSPTGFSNVIYGWLERRLMGLTPEALWSQQRGDIIDTCIRAEDYNRAVMQDRIIFAAHRDLHALENVNTEKARAGLKSAVDAGIDVIVLRLPPNEKVIATFDVPADRIDYYGLGFVPTREQLLPELSGKVRWFDYRAPEPDSYCDFVHFNQKGRAEFTTEILKIL